MHLDFIFSNVNESSRITLSKLARGEIDSTVPLQCSNAHLVHQRHVAARSDELQHHAIHPLLDGHVRHRRTILGGGEEKDIMVQKFSQNQTF